MGSLKPVIREVKEAALKGGAHARDRLHQLTDNLDGHLDDVIRKVRDNDHYDGPGSNGGNRPSTPARRPGFNPDGSVNADDFRTPRDGAYYWSGMWPRNGQEVAGKIAADNNATTLEQLLEERGIDMPEWDADNPASVATWTQASEAYAAGASGTVRAVLGDNIRPDAVWYAELDRLIANENVTQIVRVDPDSLVESVIWPN